MEALGGKGVEVCVFYAVRLLLIIEVKKVLLGLCFYFFCV